MRAKVVADRAGCARYSRAEWRAIVLAAVPLVPFVAIRFFGVGTGSPVTEAAGIGMAIVAALTCRPALPRSGHAPMKGPQARPTVADVRPARRAGSRTPSSYATFRREQPMRRTP